VIHAEAVFGLPLVHHFVEHGVLDLGPGVPRDVSAAQRDLGHLAGLEVNGKLTQAALHPAGEPDRYLAEGTAKVLEVELLVEAGEPVQQEYVTRSGAVPPLGPRAQGHMLVNWKSQELALGKPAQRAGYTRVQEPYYRAEHPVRRVGVAKVNSEPTLRAQAQHDASVRVSSEAGVPGPQDA
jgi:hypothetical protein